MLSFQRLDVYRASIELCTVVNDVRAHAPKGNADLLDQLRRATQSITLNIAEGAGRSARADKAKHYTIARGSAMEVAAQFDVLRIDGCLKEGVYELGMELLERIVAMLTKLSGL